MVSKEILDRFKKLYEEEYNIVLSDEEATDLATHFLNLMSVLIKPKPKLESENYSEGGINETG